jgi:hypothetical protein
MAEAVAAGKLDQAEADAKLAEITERITDMVNGEFEPGEGRGPGGPGHGRRGGERLDGPPAAGTDA